MLSGLPWAYSSSSGKREPRVDIQLTRCCGSLVGNPHCGLTLTWTAEESAGLEQRESDYDGEGGRACNTSTWILVEQVSTSSAQVVVQPAALPICRAKTMHHLTREVGGVQVCLTWVPRWKAFPALEPGLFPPRSGSWVIAHLVLSVATSPTWTERLGRIPRSFIVQKCLSREYGRQSWSSTE